MKNKMLDRILRARDLMDHIYPSWSRIWAKIRLESGHREQAEDLYAWARSREVGGGA